MNKEVHYEGWLIKSPPTKRIWRARWRRRWFTLKQGEIPEQFCLEYYTDRNCRKLKGVIDLDQCEQVDCGLRLENRKQKFQFMFDIKTPKRIYYLAADTEEDMRDWVNCICQVCHLHDTKQSNDMQDENRTQSTTGTALTNSSNNTTTTTINSSGGAGQMISNATSGTNPIKMISNTNINQNQNPISNATSNSNSNGNSTDILRRANNGQTSNVIIDQQPLPINQQQQIINSNNNDSAYVNTDYTNRETFRWDAVLIQQQHQQALNSLQKTSNTTNHQNESNSQSKQAIVSSSSATSSSTSGAALYLNSSMFQNPGPNENTRLAINANGVVRKIPENLVLNNTPLNDAQTSQQQSSSVQPSPALSTASGPYIPISECYSGSPKFMIDGNNPTTPLNNLDPKFYDTPRSHNNIGLNLTNDQSYSPKITNCSLHQMSVVAVAAKNNVNRSDSDSESVFTDDDEWSHPLPLRENMDRNTRPSDSSVENESFVVTYSQRFSKIPDDTTNKDQKSTISTSSNKSNEDKSAKSAKNRNIPNLDFKDNEKTQRDLPQLSDTENTSPAIGPRDATSVVDESYDIPRSHNLPYYNMNQFYDKMTSPDANPIAASTPNLIYANTLPENHNPRTADFIKSLQRPHFYTNAAPTKIEGTVFRYDFIEQGDLPPVNRALKPKIAPEDDKPPDESPAKPPIATPGIIDSGGSIDSLAHKMKAFNLQNQNTPGTPGPGLGDKPPSVDRNLKPHQYKHGSGATTPTSRRSTGAPLSMCIPNDNGNNFILETRTLPRQPRQNYGANTVHINYTTGVIQPHHQRASSATAAMQATPTIPQSNEQALQLPAKNEHKLQYFELDIANPPPINRQSINNIHNNTPVVRAPVKSNVVYNSVDFVKTEAFKRIREERKKESENVSGTLTNNNHANNNINNNTNNNNNNSGK